MTQPEHAEDQILDELLQQVADQFGGKVHRYPTPRQVVRSLTLWSDGDDQFEEAVLQEDGSVLVVGMDKSPRVSRVFGEDITSYEWVYVVAPQCVRLLVQALGGTAADDVLGLLATYYQRHNGRLYDLLCGPSVGAQFDSWQS